MLFLFRSQFVLSIFEQSQTKPVDRTQRRPEVVGDGITEGLQFLIHRYEIDISTLHFLIKVPNLIFGVLALGYVADGARNQHPSLGPQRAEADLDRKLTAVFVHPVQFQSSSHRPNSGLVEEAGPVCGVLSSTEAL